MCELRIISRQTLRSGSDKFFEDLQTLPLPWRQADRRDESCSGGRQKYGRDSKRYFHLHMFCDL